MKYPPVGPQQSRVHRAECRQAHAASLEMRENTVFEMFSLFFSPMTVNVMNHQIEQTNETENSHISC